MVGTVSAARRRPLLGAAHAAGLLCGSLAVFGTLAAIGRALAPGRAWLLAAGAVALAAVVVDAGGLRVRPQVRRQVPEAWRRRLPLPLAFFLYGLVLGTGVATYVPAAALWALLLLGAFVHGFAAPLAVAAAVALGRALPVLVLAAAVERERERRVVRLLAAVSLAVACAAVLARGAAAATVVAPAATDPSAAAGDLAWQQPGVGGFLRRAGTGPVQLPGSDPARGAALVAWHDGDAVTVAAADTLVPVLTETVPGVQKLAVAEQWLVYLQRSRGTVSLTVQSLADPTKTAPILTVHAPATISRPALDGNALVYAVNERASSRIVAIDLTNGTRRVVRTATAAQLLNPSVAGSAIVFVRVARCAQQLQLASLTSGSVRTLLTLPPLARWDAGRERGHVEQGTRVPCPGRPRATATMLWTTALAPDAAYVTELGRGGPTLVEVPR